MTWTREVLTTRGPARVHGDEPAACRARLVLGHGAGGGPDAPDLAALARALPAVGIGVWRVEQPWHVAGKRVAPAPAALDEAWLQVLASSARDVPLVLGGRSAGARVACRTAGAVDATAVVALAFPLHPPRRPERTRAGELDVVDVPLLVVQGERDPFGGPSQFSAGRRVVAVAGDHSLRADLPAVVDAVQLFVEEVLAAPITA